MVVWAAVQSQMADRRHADLSGPTYLIQGLDPCDIASIVVGQGKDAVKIERNSDGQFVVANKGNYPADAKQINELVTKSLDIKTSEVCTDSAKNHEELEVTEAKARNVVKFLKGDGSLLAGLIIGKSQESGQDTYVRLASEDRVYLAENVPWLRSKAIEYVNQELTSVKREDVNAVTVTTPEGTYTLRPQQGGDGVLLADLPADKKLKDSDAKSVFNALTSLRFEDVNKPEDIQGLVFDHTYTCRLNNSTTYKLRLAKKGEKTYLLCEAQFTDVSKVTIDPSKVDSPEELKKKEAKLLADESAQKFARRHKGWVYEIADWKAKYLTMNRSGLLEDVKKEAEPEAAPGPEAPKPLVPAQPPAEQPKAAEPAPVVVPAPAPEPNALKPSTVEPNAVQPKATEPNAVKPQ
jgi:hypothetical protein